MTENEMVTGPFYEESTVDHEPPLERDTSLVDDWRECHEPEDSFSLDVRTTMMINQVTQYNTFDERQLVELLKDCKKDRQPKRSAAGGIPLEAEIMNLLFDVHKTDHLPVGPTVDILHEVLKDIEVRKGVIKAMTDSVTKAESVARDSLYQGRQAE
jgi:hypothetical protein